MEGEARPAPPGAAPCAMALGQLLQGVQVCPADRREGEHRGMAPRVRTWSSGVFLLGPAGRMLELSFRTPNVGWGVKGRLQGMLERKLQGNANRLIVFPTKRVPSPAFPLIRHLIPQVRHLGGSFSLSAALTPSGLDESHTCSTKRRNPDTKEHILHGSIYMKFKDRRDQATV